MSEKLERQKNVYGITNTFPTFEERMYVLSTYAKNLLRLLEQGYSPYLDNTELYDRLKGENENTTTSNKAVLTEPLVAINGSGTSRPILGDAETCNKHMAS